jgi:hypothetical protein
MFSIPVMVDVVLILVTNSSIKRCVPIDDALSVEIIMIRESLDTLFWNCALMMSFATFDSILLSSAEPNCRDVTPAAVKTTGSMIAKSSIQTAIMAYLRLEIKWPSFPNGLVFLWVMLSFPFDRLVVDILNLSMDVLHTD